MTIRKIAKNGLAALSALTLAGCAFGGSPQLRSSGNPLAAGSSVTLLMPDEASEQAVGIGQLFASALQESGLVVIDDAPLEVQFAVSQRASNVELAREHEGRDVEWISRARDTYILDACEGEKSRIVMVVRDLAQNRLAYRGEGEIEGCDLGSDASRTLVREMVREAVSG